MIMHFSLRLVLKIVWCSVKSRCNTYYPESRRDGSVRNGISPGATCLQRLIGSVGCLYMIPMVRPLLVWYIKPDLANSRRLAQPHWLPAHLVQLQGSMVYGEHGRCSPLLHFALALNAPRIWAAGYFWWAHGNIR